MGQYKRTLLSQYFFTLIIILSNVILYEKIKGDLFVCTLYIDRNHIMVCSQFYRLPFMGHGKKLGKQRGWSNVESVSLAVGILDSCTASNYLSHSLKNYHFQTDSDPLTRSTPASSPHQNQWEGNGRIVDHNDNWTTLQTETMVTHVHNRGTLQKSA